MMAAQQEQMAAMAPPGAPPGAPPPAPGPAPMDSAENMPPTAQPQQERVDTLNKLKVKLLKEGKTELAEKLENRINEILES